MLVFEQSEVKADTHNLVNESQIVPPSYTRVTVSGPKVGLGFDINSQQEQKVALDQSIESLDEQDELEINKQDDTKEVLP